MAHAKRRKALLVVESEPDSRWRLYVKRKSVVFIQPLLERLVGVERSPWHWVRPSGQAGEHQAPYSKA